MQAKGMLPALGFGAAVVTAILQEGSRGPQTVRGVSSVRQVVLPSASFALLNHPSFMIAKVILLYKPSCLSKHPVTSVAGSCTIKRSRISLRLRT